MARGNNPGKDFDDQYHASRRRGQYRQTEEAWRQQSGRHAAPKESCGKAAAVLLGLLGASAWLLGEAVRYVT